MTDSPTDASGISPRAVEPPSLSLFHRAFDKLYPAIRFYHERVSGNSWYSEITPQLWLGGAPTYARDYDELLANRINAVVNIRAERDDDVDFYRTHDIAYTRYRTPDMMAPDAATVQAATDWIKAQVDDGRIVLIHCAKGRGRSATLLAGYLMREHGLSFEEAEAQIRGKRSLTKLEARHRKVLEDWLATAGPGGTTP